MLVQYTKLSELSPQELQALKGAIYGLVLEGRGSHFSFGGRVFQTAELIQAQKVWEAEKKGPGQVLLG